MVVGKLRMKKVEGNSKSDQLNQHRQARRTTRSPSIDPPPALYGPGRNELDEFPSGSSSASRGLKKGKFKQERHSSDLKADDELVIQWTTTSSNLANQLLSIPSSIKSTREFELKLKEVLNVENDDLRLESLLNDEFYLPVRWRNRDRFTHSRADLNGHRLAQLDSEEYEEYIRKRMWSQSNKRHYLESKHHEEEQQREDERARESSYKRKLDAQLKAERETCRKLRLKLKHQKRCRDRYLGRWEIINSLISSNVTGESDNKDTATKRENRTKLDESIRQVLEFEEIPWPVYPSDDAINFDSVYRGGIEQLNRRSIQEFLFGHLANDVHQTNSIQSQKKKIIRNAILAYHPDRFNRIVKQIKDVTDSAQKAKEWSLRVSQVLNELNQSID